jgi:hypothetical protein
MGELGETSHFVTHGCGLASHGSRERRIIERGQHGDCQNAERVSPTVRGGFEHLRSTDPVHGEQPDAKRGRRARRAAHGVRDIVQLEVEEYVAAGFEDARNDRRTRRREQLETDLVEPTPAA